MSSSKARFLSILAKDITTVGKVPSTNIVLPASGVTAATYGSATQIPVLTIDTEGRVTSASTTSVAGVSSFGYNTGSGRLTINTADGGSFTADVTLAPFTTTTLAEGTNQYFTTARARSSISATGTNLGYNSTTGVLSYTQGNTDTVAEGATNLYYTSARARGALSYTTGSAGYNSTSGQITIPGSSTDITEGTKLFFTDARARAALSGGTGVTYNSTTGVIAIGQPVATTDNVTFGNVTVNGTLTSDDITSTNITVSGNATITGNLTVSGTTTTVNSTTVSVADINIEVARNATTAAQANGAGLTVTGPTTPATLTYSSADDRWNLNKDLNISRVYGNLTGAVTGNASTASTLQTARSITITGDGSWTVNFDGSANVSGGLTLANSGVTAGTYGSGTAIPVLTIDAKGRVTTATTTSVTIGDGAMTVTAGSGLTGGGQVGTANQTGASSVTISHADTSSVADQSAATNTFVSGITFDTYGHVQTVTRSSPSGFLTAESDTLATVTARGNSTSTNIGSTSGTPLALATAGNVGTWIGGIQDGTSGWSLSQATIGFKSDNNTYAAIGIATAQGILYFGRTTASGVGTMSSWLEVNSAGVANFVRARPQHNGSNLALVSEIPSLSGYLTSESDTLASVTGRGASTSTEITLNGNSLWFGGSTYLRSNTQFSFLTNSGGAQAGKFLGIQVSDSYSGSVPTNGILFSTDTTFTRVGANSLQSSGDLRATIFYDSNDTGYYGDFASTSVLNTLSLTGNINFGTTTTQAGPWVISPIGSGGATPATKGTGYGRNLIVKAGNSDNNAAYAGGDLYLRAGGPTAPSTTYGVVYLTDDGGYTQVGGSLRAPIYYDSNDTNYYVDPNSVSRFAKLAIGANSYVGGMQWGTLSLGDTGTNYHYTSGWSGSMNGGILANCSDNWEFVIHDSGHRLASPFVFWGAGNNYIEMGRDLGWGTSYIQASQSFRAPIFYDSNNTAAWLDPSVTSGTILATSASSDTLGYNPSYGIYIGGINGRYIYSGNSSYTGPIFWNGSAAYTIYHSGNLPAEADTLASVTGRGASTSTRSTFNGGLTVPDATLNYFGNIQTTDYSTLTMMSRAWSSVQGTNGLAYTFNTHNNAGGGGYGALQIYYGEGGKVQAPTSFRAPIFYDSDDTSYYTDPNSGSRLAHIFAGNVSSSNDGSWNARMNLVGSSHARLDVVSNSDGIITTMYSHTGQGVGKIGTYSNHPLALMAQGAVVGGYVYNGSMRAPIFYDSDDTGYFANPNDISSFYGLAIRGDSASTAGSNQLFLWGSAGTTTSAIGFKQVGGVWGEHGRTNQGYNTYFTMDSAGRGWVFRLATVGGTNFTGTNVFSISNNAGETTIGSAWSGTANAQLNISQGQGGATLYRDIDLKGSWSGGEGHAISATHGSGITDLVGQMVFQHDGPGSRIKWGRLYASGNQSTWPMELINDGSGGAAYLQINSGSMRAPIFYDYNDTGYYVDANSRSIFSQIGAGGVSPDVQLSVNGTAHIGGTSTLYMGGTAGSYNSWGSRDYTSGSSRYFNANYFEFNNYGYGSTWSLTLSSGNLQSSSSHRAPIFYDSNDTAYYADMNAGTALKYLRVNGDWGGSPFGSSHETFTITGTYASFVQRQTNGNLGYWLHHIPTDGSYMLYGGRGNTNGSDWDWSMRAYPAQDGNYVEFRSSARAPIFYDMNDTGYYLDPAASTSLRTVGDWRANASTWTGEYSGKIQYHSNSWYFQAADQFIWRNSGGSNVVYGDQSGNHWATSSSRSPIFYDNNDTGYYIDPNSSSTSIQVAGAIEQGHNYAHPNVEWSQSGDATGEVIFYLPGTTGNYGMVHMVFDIYEYASPRMCTVIVGGHNWSTNWYNTACNVVGYTNKTVRLGVKDGRFCVVFGGTGSTWSYGQIRLRKIQNGSYYNNIMDLGGNWSASITTTESFSAITGDLRGFRTPSTMEVDGNLYAYTDVRSPTYYNYSDTAYYLDANSTSRINTINFDQLNSGTYNTPNQLVTSSDTNWTYGCHWDGVNTYYMQVKFYGTGDDTRGFRVFNTNGSTVAFRVNGAGNAIASGNVTAYSDERLKTNWRTMPEDYVTRLAQVKVGIYDRVDESKLTQVGVGAQSLQKLLPEAVDEAADEIGTLSVNYGGAALASAVELAKKVVEQEERIKRLEALVETLINKLGE